MDISKFKGQLSENIVMPMLAFMEECGEDCDFTEKDVLCRSVNNKFYCVALLHILNTCYQFWAQWNLLECLIVHED